MDCNLQTRDGTHYDPNVLTVTYIERKEPPEQGISMDAAETACMSDIDISMLIDTIVEEAKYWGQQPNRKDLIIVTEGEFALVMHYRALRRENDNNFLNNIIRNITVNKNSCSAFAVHLPATISATTSTTLASAQPPQVTANSPADSAAKLKKSSSEMLCQATNQKCKERDTGDRKKRKKFFFR